jgi:hypothetical protein
MRDRGKALAVLVAGRAIFPRAKADLQPSLNRSPLCPTGKSEAVPFIFVSSLVRKNIRLSA